MLPHAILGYDEVDRPKPFTLRDEKGLVRLSRVRGGRGADNFAGEYKREELDGGVMDRPFKAKQVLLVQLFLC